MFFVFFCCAYIYLCIYIYMQVCMRMCVCVCVCVWCDFTHRQARGGIWHHVGFQVRVHINAFFSRQQFVGCVHEGSVFVSLCCTTYAYIYIICTHVCMQSWRRIYRVCEPRISLSLSLSLAFTRRLIQERANS